MSTSRFAAILLSELERLMLPRIKHMLDHLRESSWVTATGFS